VSVTLEGHPKRAKVRWPWVRRGPTVACAVFSPCALQTVSACQPVRQPRGAGATGEASSTSCRRPDSAIAMRLPLKHMSAIYTHTHT